METVVTIHSIVRWFVVVALLGGGLAGLAAARRPDAPFQNAVYSIAVMILDVQVALGFVLYLFNEGWSEGGFIAVFHPLAMLLALGFAHAMIARTRGTAAEGDTAAANRIAGTGLLVTLLIVFAAVPWQR